MASRRLSPYARSQEKNRTRCTTTKPKRSPSSAMDSSPRWYWKRCRAANSHGAPRRSPRASTTCRTPPAVRSPSTPCWNGPYAIAATDSPRLSPSPARTAVNSAPSHRKPPRSSSASSAPTRIGAPSGSGTALLRQLAPASEPHLAGGLSASTLYRFLRARGLTERQLLLDKATSHKKYEAQFANQIWQSDMLFGPWVGRPGGGKQQVFLQAALDDASHLIPHAQFYANQGLDAFLDCLRQAIAARGVPTRLYMDNAKIYRSPQLARIAASIGILIVHTPPYQPEGRGKIERFFRSVREQFLASLDPKVLLSLDQLNERLWHWLDTVYHRHEHSSLGTTPLMRWQRDIEQVRQLPPATDLRRLFFHRVDRLVRRDSTFLLKNRFFEAPAHLASKRIEVRFDPLDLTQLEIHSEGKPEGIARLVDAVVNC